MKMLRLKYLKNNTIKNGIWMYIMQFFNTVIPLISLPYITRILGASQYGVFSIALNILGYFQVIVEYGFGMSATRKIALSNKGKEEINKTFTTVLIVRFILLLFCCTIMAVYLIVSKENITVCLCLLTLMSGLIGNCIQLNWLFQGMQQMQFISIASIISRTISVILTFLLVKDPNDIYIYCILYSAAPISNGIMAIIMARRKYALKFVKINCRDLVSEIKSGWYVFTTQLSSKVFGAVGVTFLGFLASEAEVGIYSAISKIPNIIILAWTPISQVIYPISSQKLKDSYCDGRKTIKKFHQIIVLFIVACAMLLSVFSSLLVQFVFGSEYAKFSYWLIPLLGWVVVAINNNFWGIQTLLGSGHDREYGKCFHVGVFCTVLFNFGLIYIWGGSGAAWAPLLSEIVLAILLHREIGKLDNNVKKEPS